MKKQLLALAAAVAVSPAAMAQQGYFGADFSFVNAEFEFNAIPGTYESDPTALRFRGGAELNENVALEGVIGLGLQDDEIEQTDLELGLESMFGVYAVGLLPLDRTFSLYGKVGFVAIEYELDSGESDDDTGVSFGIGAKLNVDRNAAMIIEYTVLPEIEDAAGSLESDMISIGAQFAF